MATDLLDQDQDQEEASSRRDPELLLVGQVLRKLSSLEIEAQRRVFLYVADRLGLVASQVTTKAV